jgi:hypothetical protein
MRCESRASEPLSLTLSHVSSAVSMRCCLAACSVACAAAMASATSCGQVPLLLSSSRGEATMYSRSNSATTGWVPSCDQGTCTGCNATKLSGVQLLGT